MRTASRWLTGTAAVLAAGLLVLGDPYAPQAMAFQPPPPPVSFPSSVLSGVNSSAGNTFDATTWNKTLTNNPKALPTGGTAGKVGGQAAGGAAAVALLLGIDVGTNIAGVIGLPTSGSFVCDLSTLVGTTYGCAPVAAPEYVPNSDLPPSVAPGFTPGTGQVWTAFPSRLIGWELVSGPAFGATGAQTATVRATASGWTEGSAFTAVEVWCTGGASPITTIGVSLSSTQPIRQVGGTFTCAAGFDHIRFPAGTFNPALRWYPEGHTLRPPQIDADPWRWWRTTWQCSTGSPGGQTSSAAFRETDPEWPSFPTAQCDPGAIVTSVLVEQLTEGGLTTTLLEWTAPETLTDFAAANPECVGGGCELLLMRIDEVTGKRLSCHVDASLCVGWQTDLETPPATERFECIYGGQVVALAECKVYNFEPDQPLYNDPATGEPAPQTDPEAPGQSNQCPPPFSWTSLFNPWWYYKSATCALEWAFVPPPSSTSLNRIRVAIGGTPPAVFAAELTGFFDGLTVPAGSCQGPELRWDFVDATIYPFDACSGANANLALWSRRLSYVAVGLFGAMASLRALGSGFGWKPSAGGDA